MSRRAGPLNHVKVLEFQALAPVPMVGMMLADYGAQVIRVDRPGEPSDDVLSRGKTSIAVALKSEEGRKVVLDLIRKADVVLDPYRPGVLEKLGFGPSVIEEASGGKAILARLTGFPRNDPKWGPRAGHDINYLALSGVMSLLKPPQSPTPTFPVNLLADFAGGSMICIMGILIALLERTKSGRGQVIEVDMMSGLRYMSTFPILHNIPEAGTHYWTKPSGENYLDGGAPFYGVYVCKDGKFITVGALEPQFFAALMKHITSQCPLPDSLARLNLARLQSDQRCWPSLKIYFTEAFASKSRDEWVNIFGDSDSCTAPVLTLEEAARAAPNSAPSGVPAIAPHLRRTPGIVAYDRPVAGGGLMLTPGQDSLQVLKDLGYSKTECDRLLATGAVSQAAANKPRAKL